MSLINEEAVNAGVEELYETIHRLYTGQCPKLLLASYGHRTWYWYETMMNLIIQNMKQNKPVPDIASKIHATYFNRLEPENYIHWEHETEENKYLWYTVTMSAYTVYRLVLAD